MKARLIAIFFLTAGFALVTASAVAASEPGHNQGALPVLHLNLGSTDPAMDPDTHAEWAYLLFRIGSAEEYNSGAVNAFGRANYGNWNNLVCDGLLELAAQTADINTRAPLYRQAEEILVETDAVMLPIYYYANGIATKPCLDRSCGAGGYGGRIADWRMTRQVFLALTIENL